ncbi:hypothetical protein GCM10027047_12250 [Rhodococcus aerolatus]
MRAEGGVRPRRWVAARDLLSRPAVALGTAMVVLTGGVGVAHAVSSAGAAPPQRVLPVPTARGGEVMAAVAAAAPATPASLPAAPAAVPVLAPHPTAAPGAVVPPGALLELPSGPLGIPGAVLVAYRKVADELAASTTGCHMTWNLLAGIGRIESGHASGGRVDAAGTTLGPILGPVLDGANPGDGVVRDTDGGRLDGNTSYDRAVGPMQFIPGTWAVYGADGNGDGVVDPNNVYDASLGAGRYLCSGGLDVADPAQARTAVYRYNNSDAYVSNVLAWSAAYARGVEPTASELGPVPAPATAAAPAPSVAPASAPTVNPTPPTGAPPAAPTQVTPTPAPVPIPAPRTVPAPAPATNPAPATTPAPAAAPTSAPPSPGAASPAVSAGPGTPGPTG